MLINNIKRKIYYHLTRNTQLKIKESSKRRVYLFGMPQYMNYGDIAIFVAEVKFLKHFFSDREIITIPERFVDKGIISVKKIIKENDVVAYQGGGNMGDIWEDNDVPRRKVFDAFNDYKIISFPESISFSSEEWSLKMEKILSQCKDINIFIRETKSFKLAREIFPKNVKIYLCPDMVMFLNKQKDYKRKEKILIVLRSDKEKLNNRLLSPLIEEVKEKYNCEFSDTFGDKWQLITEKNIEKVLDKKLLEFQRSKVVITDRLHGMILSFITGTPVIVFDNNNHKISSTYRTWLMNNKNILFVSEDVKVEQILNFIDKNLLNDKKLKIDHFDFNNLVSAFKN